MRAALLLFLLFLPGDTTPGKIVFTVKEVGPPGSRVVKLQSTLPVYFEVEGLDGVTKSDSFVCRLLTVKKQREVRQLPPEQWWDAECDGRKVRFGKILFESTP